MDEAERCTRVGFMSNGRIATIDTPEAIKRRLPGTLYEIETSEPRAAQSILGRTPWIQSTTVLGSAIRALVSAETSPDSLVARLNAEGVDVTRIEAIPVDMEAAFAFLFGEHTSAEAEDSSDSGVAEGGEQW
jgi:ABC-2 type transport system ATP-binding protein